MSRFIRSFFILLMLVPALMTGFTLVGAQDDTTQIEIIGVIDAMTSTSITINGLVIDISVAEINTPMAVGAEVKVQGSLAVGGLIVAREVNNPLGTGTGADDDTSSPIDELEIRGVLSAINGTLYTIGGQVVEGSLAEIKAGVVVGAIVKAHASISADGTWVAREIEGISSDDDDFSDVTQLEYVGTLNAIGADSVLVDALTFITVNAQMSPSLIVGIRVHVEGTVVDGVLVAREVRPATADDNSNDNSDDNGNDDNGNDNSDDNGNDDNGNDDNGNDNVAVCPPVMPNGWTTYTVRAGDSVSRIAQITDTDFDDLVAVNCITNPSTIFVGQVLFVENAARSGGGSDDNGNSNSNDNGDDDNGNDDGSNSNSNSNDNGDDDNDDNGNDDGDNGNDDSGSDDND